VVRPSPVQDDEAREVFARLQCVIRTTLLTYYQLTPDEAQGAEEDLLVWFLRLARRGGGPQTSHERSLRLALLSAACQYGRSLQLWKLGGRRADPELREVLSREPEELALHLARGFDQETS
jgi:hypothetical protein